MFQLFSTPSWFNGWDIAFNIISIVVALLIAGFSWRVYSFNKENKYAYFSFAFILVALGLLFQSFTNGVLYFTPIRDTVLDVLRPAAGQGLRHTDLFYRGAFFIQMASMLGAWMLIFFLSQKSRARLTKFYEVSQIALFGYFILLISFVSNFTYLVFYLTSLVILGLIVLNYYKNYLNVQRKNAWLAMTSFLLIFMAHICFIFVFIHTSFYAFGSMLMLLGFLTLLSVYMKSTKAVMR